MGVRTNFHEKELVTDYTYTVDRTQAGIESGYSNGGVGWQESRKTQNLNDDNCVKLTQHAKLIQ